jgi:hypothetical protein
MGREMNVWKSAVARVGAALTVALIGAHGSAWASCADHSSSSPSAAGAALMSTVYHPEEFGRSTLIRVDDERPAIVGLWQFEMLAKSTPAHVNPMPDGTLIDFGTAAWHGDGTELMNSGGRNPADGDFCQGVWKQVGPSTFVLNHVALAWTNGAYTGPAKIQEWVNVQAGGTKITGTFVLTQYLASPTQGHEFDESTVLVSITGTINGTRITPN